MELSKIKTKNVNDKKCIIHLKNKIAKSHKKTLNIQTEIISLFMWFISRTVQNYF